MRVGQENKIKLRRRGRKRDVLKCVKSLLHSIIDQDFLSGSLQIMAAARDLVGRPDKCDLHKRPFHGKCSIGFFSSRNDPQRHRRAM